MIQLIKEDGTVYGPGSIQIIDKYGKPKIPVIPPSATVWGTITGTVTAQTDLTGYISSNYYPLLSNPAGYITSSSLTGYVPYTGATSNVNLGTYNLTAPLVTSTGNLTLNATGNVELKSYNTAIATFATNSFSFFPVSVSSGFSTTFTFTKPNNTNQTASANMPGWNYQGGSRQWLAGAIANQTENVWGAVTYSFTSASTITNAYGNVFNAPIAGTNCTILANWAAQFNGGVEVIGLKGLTITTPTAGVGNGAIRQGISGAYTFTIDGANGSGPRLGLGSTPSSGYDFFEIGAFSSANNFATKDRNFRILTTISTVQDARFVLFANTGNLTLQNGGTFTDNGYRLEVVGTSKFTDRVNIGNYASPSAQRMLTVGQDTAFITMGSMAGSTTLSAIYFNTVTPSNVNFALMGNGGTTQLGTTNVISFSRSGTTFMSTDFGMRVTWNMTSNSFGYTPFNYTKNSVTGGTASTALPGWNYLGGSTQWATGTIAVQAENIWGAATYSFIGASTITKAIGNVFNAPVAGTNTTITANWAAQFNGNVEMVGAMTALYYMSVSNPNAVATASARFQVTNAAGNLSQFSIASNSDAVDPSLLSIGGSNKGVEFSSNSVRALKILDGSRNVTIQNGGTVTDNGYRLEVFGTTNVVGTTLTDGVTFSGEQLTTGTGVNWTGTGYATGYTHTAGSVDPLVSSNIPGAGSYLQISFTMSGRTAGSVNITYITYVINGFNTNITVTTSIRANGSGPGFTITPTTDFNGTIVVSVKYVTASIAALSTYKGSLLGITNEIRSIPGTQNTVMGVNVGRYLTTGNGNVIMGYNAMPNVMTGSSNVAIGTTAGVTNVSGTNNAYIGSGAGYLNSNGSNNVCVGAAAGYGSTGQNNIFLGVSAGNSSSGGTNTAIGVNALYTNTTGGNNNVIGFGSMQSNTTGSYNDALGREAAFGNTTGSNNQFFGFRAGRYIADGTTANTVTENSIFIGVTSKALASGQTNQIVIGYNSTGIGSNTTVLGNSSTVTTAIYGNLMLGTTTASTYKLDVQGTANILTSLNIGNYATPTAQRIFTVGQDTAFITMGSIPSVTGNAGIWLNQPTPSAYNVSVRVDLNNLWINSPGAGGSIMLTTGGLHTPVRMYGALNTSSVASYVWTKPTYLNGTASTAIPGWSYDGTTRQWLTGNITTQNENVWGATTYSFVGASTIATAFGNVFNKAVAGTNCTITSNYSAQFNGTIQIAAGDIHFSNQNWVIGGLPATSGIITYNGGVGYSFTTGSNATTDFKWQTGYTDRLRLFGATGNMLIQNGGTLTDAGYKLDVQGTTRITGDTTIGSTNQLIEIKQTATAPSYTMTGSSSSVFRLNAGTRSLLFESYAVDQNYFSSTGARFIIRTTDAQNIQFFTNNTSRLFIPATGGLQFSESNNLIFGTTTGTKFGETNAQKLAFWNATPIVQPTNTTSLNGVLETTGLMASGSTSVSIDKQLNLVASTLTNTSLNIPIGVAPTTPVNGDIWYNGTDLKLKSNGLTKDLTTATTLDNLVFSGSYMPAKLGYVAASHTAGINGVLISKKISGRKTCTITSLSVWCLTGVAGGNVRLAVYSDLNGLPNTLLADTGNIACISSGLKEGTITPLTLVSGTTYHVAHQVSSGTISLKYNISEETSYYDPTNFVYVFSISSVFVFAAFPTTFPAVTYQNGAGYNEIIYLKAQ